MPKERTPEEQLQYLEQQIFKELDTINTLLRQELEEATRNKSLSLRTRADILKVLTQQLAVRRAVLEPMAGAKELTAEDVIRKLEESWTDVS